MTDDAKLLNEYASSRSQPAFAELARRYTDLVYSSAKRQLGGDAHLAEDVTQAVFIILSQKAKSVPADRPISGWLLKVTGYCAANARRQRGRRESQERKAAEMARSMNSEQSQWNELAPMLDQGLNKLARADRDALLLRFFEHKSLREVGAAMGTTEEAAQKRVTRAIEKLRSFFQRRGVATLSAATLATLLEAQAVHAAPTTLTATTAAASAGATSSLAKGAMTFMAIQQAKTIAIAAAAVLLAVGGATITVKSMNSPASSGSVRKPISAQVAPGAATFADGTSVEIMGISELGNDSGSTFERIATFLSAAPATAPAGAPLWWRPDGSPIADANFPAPHGNINLGDNPQQRRVRLMMAVHGQMDPGASVPVNVIGSTSTTTDRRTSNDQTVINCSVAVPRAMQRTDVRVGMSRGQWHDDVNVSAAAAAETATTRGSAFGKLGEEDGMTTVEIFTMRLKERPDLDTRYMVIKRDGTREMCRQLRGYSGKATAYFPCAKSDVDRIVVASRPLEWVTLSNVAIAPPADLTVKTGLKEKNP